MSILKLETKNRNTKAFYSWFIPTSVTLLPLCFICIVPIGCVYAAKCDYYVIHQKNNDDRGYC